MGMLDKLKVQASGLKDKAVDTATKNSDKISGGLDKAGEFVDKRTKGKYTDKIETSKAKAKQGLEKLDKNNVGGSMAPDAGTSASPPVATATSPDAAGTTLPLPGDDLGSPPPYSPSDPAAPPPPLS